MSGVVIVLPPPEALLDLERREKVGRTAIAAISSPAFKAELGEIDYEKARAALAGGLLIAAFAMYRSCLGTDAAAAMIREIEILTAKGV